MIELFVVKEDEWIELVTEDIKLSGQRYQAARSLEASIIIKQGQQQYDSVEEGDTVLFKWKGTELFRGVVFMRTPNDHKLTFTAFDMLHYLVKNKDVYVFTQQRADEMVRRIANDFQIPVGNLENTQHVISSLVFKNDTSLYDIILKALEETKSQTSQHYQLCSEQGKLHLRGWPDPEDIWAIEQGVNLIDYQFSTSINDTATRVKMRMTKGDQSIIKTANDDDGAHRFGILQYVENVQGDMNEAQLQQRVNVEQAQRKGVKKDLKSIKAIGIPELQSGLPVQLIIPDVGVNQKYFIEKDSHEFRGHIHMMTIDIVQENKLSCCGSAGGCS